MPELWDKTPDAPPQSELNPLTNPVLEQNLVRWAQVYFSSPPGKREQAVNKLLEEIKREASGDRAVETHEVVCSACRHRNSAGHKFCGGCGEALNPVTSGSSENSGAAAAQPETSVQWLRDRAFSSLEVSDAPKQRGWLYLVGALAIALAGFAYLQSRDTPTRYSQPLSFRSVGDLRLLNARSRSHSALVQAAPAAAPEFSLEPNVARIERFATPAAKLVGQPSSGVGKQSKPLRGFSTAPSPEASRLISSSSLFTALFTSGRTAEVVPSERGSTGLVRVSELQLGRCRRASCPRTRARRSSTSINIAFHMN